MIECIYHLIIIIQLKYKSNTFLCFINYNLDKNKNKEKENNIDNKKKTKTIDNKEDINKLLKENEEYKNEIDVYKNEIDEYKSEINNYKNEINEYKNEMNEYKKKINELEKNIEELKIQLKEKDELIKNEKIKNDNLNKKINENEIVFNDNSKTNNADLENEVKLFREFYHFSSNEKLISIKFISGNQDIDFTLITKNTEIFTKIESILYEKYPTYKDSENYFIVNGNRINRHRTLEENKIKNNDVLTLEISNFD